MFARVIKTNEIVDVRQAKAGDVYFLDNNTSNPYKVSELDFSEPPKQATQMPYIMTDDDPMKGLAFFMDGQNDKHYENEKAAYFRHLKGDIILSLIESGKVGDDVVDMAHNMVERLKKLDKLNGNIE